MVWKSVTRSASDPVCTTTVDAATVATNYAATNGVSIPTSDVSFSSNYVTVTTPDPTPALFAGLFGLHNARPTAVAVAKWGTDSASNCSSSQQSAGQCYFIFARDTNCAGNNTTVSITHNGTGTFQGGIWSNGSLSSNNTGNANWPATYFGNGSNCKWSRHGDKNETYGTCQQGGVSQTTPCSAQALQFWPRDWTTVVTTCSGASCSGPGGTPAFCTDAAVSFPSLSPVAGHVYCAYGSGSPSNPSSWTGTISVSSGNTNSTGLQASYIGGSVTLALQSNNNLAAQLSTGLGKLLIYANNAATVTSQGNATLTGDIFVPNGTATVNSGGGDNLTTFIEAQDVSMNVSGNITGDGPAPGPDGAPTPGADILIQ
jgi:hypothetical protein